MSDQLIPLPKSSSHIEYQQLGYMDSYDAIAEKDYAFLVYKETKLSSGKWVVKISSACTAGTVIDADQTAVKSNIQRAFAKGKKFVVWGFNFSSSDANDPRIVENRIYFNDDKCITDIEIHLVTRKGDGTANEKLVLKVAWPG
ncbi:MAG: hypothetical protein HQK83_17860 [Fibrobacteria bacterium]|nr:hypothetical protein [Fibrobacteria bacterium]